MACATRSLVQQLCCLAAGPLLGLLVSQLPPPQGLTEHGMVCAGACLWLLIWWVTEVLPLPVTSLMAIPVFMLMDVMNPVKVFSYIAHPAMMLIFGATIIVGVWKESNLIERYAYWCFNLPFIKGNARRMIFVFTLGAGIMSAIAPNLPLVILFISISVAMAKSCGLTPENNMTRSLCTVSAIAPMLGGIGTPLGGAPNILVIAVVATVLGHDISFWEWTCLGMPICVIILLCSFVITSILFPVTGNKGISIPKENIQKKLAELGPITLYEHAAIWIMVVALILWCFGPQIFSALGFEEAGRTLTAPVVAVLVGIIAFIIPVKRDKESGKLIFSMDWGQAVRNIGWGIIILQVGAVAFGQVLLDGGVDKYLASTIQSALGNISGLYVWAALVLITGFVSQIIMCLALIPLMIPITAQLATLYGFDPLLACLSIGFVSNLTMMFPFSSVAVASVMAGSEGFARSKDFIFTGFIHTIVITFIVFFFCWLCGPTLLALF